MQIKYALEIGPRDHGIRKDDIASHNECMQYRTAFMTQRI
jgi:hypothetical protein